MEAIFLDKRGRLSKLIFVSLCFVLLVAFFGISSTGEEISVEKVSFFDLPSSFEVKKGEEFILDIDFDEDFVFSDDSDLLFIDKDTGLLSFVSEEIGEFNVIVIVFKDMNNFYSKLIIFKVVE